MRFDDRLRTVLLQPAGNAHDVAVRWRQLVELVARAPEGGERALIGEAIAEIGRARQGVDERVRVAAALAIAGHPLPPELVSVFAADTLAVAAPILASARLTESEWRAVAASASDECRAFISTMRSGQRAPAAPAEEAKAEPVPSIGEVVARIERIRHSREIAEGDDQRAPASECPRMFRWECNAAGEIEWVEGAPRGALVGQSIARGGGPCGVGRSVERAFAYRTPFRDGLLELPGDQLAGGSWKISGVPAFDRSSGRFAGYRGLAERPSSRPDAAADPDSLRELAHEIKTPLNAIIGFAEIITGEYLGPADDHLRDRAGEIVTQAQQLLSAIDDLDLAARAQSATAPAGGTKLGELVEELAPGLRERATARGAELHLSGSAGDLDVAVQADLARRLIARMCDAVIERAESGERLSLSLEPRERDCLVAISKPDALARLGAGQMFDSAADGQPGENVSLRLVRGLASIASVGISADGEAISLAFPRA